jgi:hypothetical protein
MDLVVLVLVVVYIVLLLVVLAKTKTSSIIVHTVAVGIRRHNPQIESTTNSERRQVDYTLLVVNNFSQN